MSLTTEQICAVEDVVEAKMQADVSFTAYEITLALRADGYWVEHVDVRDYVHDFMDSFLNDSYVRTLEQVTPTAQAYLYSPADQDVNANAIDDEEDDEDCAWDAVTLMADARGRLCIPAKIARSYGFRPGDFAVCKDECDHISITGCAPDQWDGWISSYYVDKDNNIRISRKTLVDALGVVSQYKVYHDDLNERIVVEGTF